MVMMITGGIHETGSMLSPWYALPPSLLSTTLKKALFSLDEQPEAQSHLYRVAESGFRMF